ncbi:hypothetical protein EPR50_G00167860 [Perca flavescens]|uniref:Transmembrane protein TMEM132 cohesin-like domain-containing protein n=1 Tax=Perca flavescens TaxID=8167 RepID=A0A484CIW5_PERFV|nr:hypothetical protein EPR50_G00167860 [Perca flavescens]
MISCDRGGGGEQQHVNIVEEEEVMVLQHLYIPQTVTTSNGSDRGTKGVKLKDGVVFLGARATNPVLWTVSQDVRSEGHRVVTLHCRRKENSFSQRVEAPGYQRVLQVDLEVNGLMMTPGRREVTWQVEYPLTRTLTSEVPTLIRLAPQDLGGIVPLAMVSSGGLSCGWKLVCMQTFLTVVL